MKKLFMGHDPSQPRDKDNYPEKTFLVQESSEELFDALLEAEDEEDKVPKKWGRMQWAETGALLVGGSFPDKDLRWGLSVFESICA